MMVVRNNIIPFKGYKAINLFGILFCRRDAVIGSITLNHEYIHTMQMREMLYIPFYIWYGIEWLIKWVLYRDAHLTYHNISFEKEAFLHEKDMGYSKNRRHFTWIKYILN